MGKHLLRTAFDSEIEAYGKKTDVQITKITNDSGGVKISNQSVGGDILALIVAQGLGLHSFYSIVNSVSNPPGAASIRGFAQMTSATFGWVYATDSNNKIYTNYLDNNVWRGWKRLEQYDDTTKTELWTGAFYPVASHTITPSKKLSECRNGWILLWSDYDSGSGANDYDFTYCYIPKYSGIGFMSGKQHSFSLASFSSPTTNTTIVKKLYIYDDKVVGHDDNGLDTTLTNDVCLRAILEW